MSEEHTERIYLQRAPPIISPQLYRELLEDPNVPAWIRRDLWGITTHLQTQANLSKDEYKRLKARQHVIMLLYLMSLPPDVAAKVYIHLKQVDLYSTLLLTRSLYGYERATLLQQTPVQQQKEEKKGFLEKLFGF